MADEWRSHLFTGLDEDARRSDGLFEENLKPWADAMEEASSVWAQ